MSVENFTELLIDTVREYPVLYDTAHADYKNNRIKNKIWDGIAKTIGESDGDTLKTKWKNLRDAYSKHLRSSKTHTGQAAKLVERYKTWPWVKQMSFLRPYLEFAPTHSNVQENDLAVASTSHQETADIHPPPLHQHSRRAQDSKQNETQVDKVINFLNNNKRHTDFDDIDLVFLGYAKTIKKMSKSRQARVKFQFAKILMESELEQVEESSQRTLKSPENDRFFTVSTPLHSPGDDINESSRDYEYIVSSPPEPTASTLNDVNSTADINTQNTDPFSFISSCMQSQNANNLPKVIIFPASETTSASYVTYAQSQQPTYVNPR